MLRTAWRRYGARALAAAALAAAFSGAFVATGTPRQARAAGPGALLPNLIAERPTEPYLTAESFKGGPRKLLLRFNGYIHNAGRGALDMTGAREAPHLSHRGEEELRAWEKTHEGMSPGLERELSEPPMRVQQRLFTTNVGEGETNIERAHIDEPSNAVMIYANADGHNHWHLQHVAKYSLWNLAQSGEVAPSQKVGFCLLDSEHVDGFGPSNPVYEDAVRGEFCERFKPQAVGLREGISRGWRDRYQSELAFQWVDASNVAPGQYWLREDVNPDRVIQEEGTGEKFRYASEPTVIPGYVAKPVSVAATGAPQRIRLESQTFKGSHKWDQPSGQISYSIVAAPRHGVLGPVSGNEVTYTPTGSYAGPDAFTYSARDANSEYPYSPPTAAVSVEGPAPSVVISGAQPEMIIGTSVSLSALVAHDASNVEWAASGGSLAPGPGGRTAAYQAPAQTGTVTITARLADDPEAASQATIMIKPVPPATPAQQLPVSSSGSLGAKATSRISRPRAMLFGRRLVMTTTPSLAGRVRLSAYLHRRRLGTCYAETPAGRAFTCRLTIPHRVSLRSRFEVIASLRAQKLLYTSVLGPAPIPEMRMRPIGAGGHAAARTYWCSPSTLVPVLVGGED